MNRTNIVNLVDNNLSCFVSGMGRSLGSNTHCRKKTPGPQEHDYHLCRRLLTKHPVQTLKPDQQAVVSTSNTFHWRSPVPIFGKCLENVAHLGVVVLTTERALPDLAHQTLRCKAQHQPSKQPESQPHAEAWLIGHHPSCHCSHSIEEEVLPAVASSQHANQQSLGALLVVHGGVEGAL